MSELIDWLNDHADIMEVVEMHTVDNGGVNFFVKIDGTYSKHGAEGMLEYHQREFRRVLASEGIVLGVRK